MGREKKTDKLKKKNIGTEIERSGNVTAAENTGLGQEGVHEH